MVTKPQCDKCGGSGLIPREIDSDIHPILAKHPEICDVCGGEGVKPLADAHAANRAAAKALDS